MNNKCTILAVGDIVNDVHLYITPPDPMRFDRAQASTKHIQHRGGAALTLKLLQSAAKAVVQAKADKTAKQKAEDKLEGKGPDTSQRTEAQAKDEAAKEAKKLEDDKQDAAATIGLAPAPSAEGSAASQDLLTSYGIWTPHTAKPGAENFVWRVSTQGGYAITAKTASGSPQPIASEASAKPAANSVDALDPVDALVLDDGALAFRYD